MNTHNIKPKFTPTVERLIDANAAAKVLGLHPATVRIMARDGRLPGLRIGTCWRFRESSLDAWIEEELARSIKREQ